MAMLEIPEAYVLAQQLEATVVGKAVQGVIANASPHKFAWFHGDPALYAPQLTGLAVEGAQPRGGQVELRLGAMRLVLCEGINARYLAPGEAPPKTHQLLLSFADGSALSCTVQMYGGMYAFAQGTLDNPYYLLSCQKPSPLTEGFSEAYFEGLRRDADAKLSLKAFLATEQRVPGLGNGVLQDLLFEARLHPKRKLGTLSDSAYAGLYHTVVDTLWAMARAGGRDVETDLFGRAGGYATRCSRLTVGQPCAVCGTAIAKESYMGGAIYFCPTCQPAPAK